MPAAAGPAPAVQWEPVRLANTGIFQKAAPQHRINRSPGPCAPQAVAALLQGDTSAIAVLKSSGISRPAQLQSKKYASYGARFEGRIVQQLIRNDGGAGDYTEAALPMLGVWDTVLEASPHQQLAAWMQ